MKNYGKEEHVLEAENKKLEEDKEKLKTELKKASDGNVVCLHKSRSIIFYAVKLHCFC